MTLAGARTTTKVDKIEGYIMAKKGVDTSKARAASIASKRGFATQEELQSKIDSYFDAIDATFDVDTGKGEIPTEMRLAKHIGVTLSTMQGWYDGDVSENDQWITETIRLAYQEITSRYMQLVNSGDKNLTSFVIFLLKQRRFGGYQDKIEEKKETTVKIIHDDSVTEEDFK